ncbi:MAG: hypothetical protein D6775_15610 [Caldilineae bacterium]|nr:MAG: hypothetical protein D6775_15610 [Caldilineae bacterium]
MKPRAPIVFLLTLSILATFGLQLISAGSIGAGYLASPHQSSPLLFLPYIHQGEPTPEPEAATAWMPGYLHGSAIVR